MNKVVMTIALVLIALALSWPFVATYEMLYSDCHAKETTK